MHLAPEEVIEEIHRLKPYPGGSQYLNAVKVLDERDKHHVILTVGTAAMFTVAQMGSLIGEDKVRDLPPELFMSTVGDFIVSLDGETPVEVFDKKADFQPPFTVGLAQEEEMGGMPVLVTLRKMVDATSDAVIKLAIAYSAGVTP